MKRLIILCGCMIFSFALLAQDEEEKEKEKEKGGWKSDHLFIGSGINLGFSNGFIIGLNPEIGYSINKFLDAGLATNVTYITQRSQYANNSIRYLTVGGGPFVRVWPVRMIFIGGQYEYNWITLSEKLDGVIIDRAKTTAGSLLVGLGYGNRTIGESQFYTSIMIDALKDPNSPYRDGFGRIQPVFRTGFLFYLGRNK